MSRKRCDLPFADFSQFPEGHGPFLFHLYGKKIKKISTNLTFKQPVKILGKFRESLVST